ncbi:ubiquitin-associated protein 1-like [Megalobrama amblycephala]|uniref:ubiquitin-associated protein 1-like n=1 Tax=Megalobrama amblycephala TaxID=75352 RepID=UPI00201475FE|nr:ubiquitin-associated protein 1-like [Megalobrama amblycephala]XP_048014553.1 ubiquitin-associated protein 1-like [Megalobrama amblycephala]XP_048014554.1 ubiquitin-associated protein 1-like [Megalobrama amblycephala]
MCSLDEVPFKVALDSVEIQLGQKEPVTAPEVKIPDCAQILRDTKYSFTLEKRIMAVLGEQQRKKRKTKKAPPSVSPTCPPFWLMFNSPQQSRMVRIRSAEFWELGPRPRSLSLSAADSHRPRPLRAVQFLIADTDCEGGSDDESSSTEEDDARCKERPKSSGSQCLRCSVRQTHRVSTPRPAPSCPPPIHKARPSSASSLKDIRKPVPSALSQTPQGSPHGSRAPRRKPVVMRNSGRRNSLTLLQPRPSSAGPLPSARPQKPASNGVRPRTSAGLQDTPVDLLCALSQEERDLLEAVTQQGYTLRTAILALQRTGPKSLDQILSYLTSCDRLCRLGYEKTQVEEALEMFQNCESKASEFLFLLAQFCEMGFQQSTIKEVLLVHENHKERALEELMTRSG